MPTPRLHSDGASRQAAYRARMAAARTAERTAKGLPPAPAVPTIPGTARWDALLQTARAALETVREEMQEYFDDRTEGWQEGERGASMQERIDAIDALLSDLDGLE